MASTKGPIANIKGSTTEAGDTNPQHVIVVDQTGALVSFGGSGGTSSTDGAGFTANTTVGTPAMGVYEATPTTVADNDQAIVGITANRELKVSVTSGGTAGTQYTEGDTDATITGTALLFEGAANALVAATGTAAHGLDVDVTRVSGTVTVDGSGVTQPVSGTVTASLAAGTNNIGDVDVLSVVPGTGATALGKAEDAAHASGDVGVMALAVRVDAAASIAGADGDYTPLQVDANGALRVTGGGGGTEYTEGDTDTTLTGTVALMEGAGNTVVPLQGTAADGLLVNLGANNDVTVAGTVTANAGSGTFAVSNAGTFAVQADTEGRAAHDAPIDGKPLRIGGRALSADYTAVATGDTADVITSLLGKLIVLPFALPALTWSYAAAASGITNTSDVEAKAAGGAGVRNYITHVDVVNGHASTATEVVIKDGATVLWRGYASAGGGGVSANFAPPLRGTANTAVNVANLTTGAATYVNLTGFVAAE